MKFTYTRVNPSPPVHSFQIFSFSARWPSILVRPKVIVSLLTSGGEQRFFNCSAAWSGEIVIFLCWPIAHVRPLQTSRICKFKASGFQPAGRIVFPQSCLNVPIIINLLCKTKAPLCGNNECILPELNLKPHDCASSEIWCNLIFKLLSWDLAGAQRTCITCSFPVSFEIIIQLKRQSIFENPVEMFSTFCRLTAFVLCGKFRPVGSQAPNTANSGVCLNENLPEVCSIWNLA